MKTFKTIAGYNRETEKAIELRFTWKDMNFFMWFPKSQITFLDKNDQGDCEILIPFWLLYKNQSKADVIQNMDSNSAWCDMFRQQDRNGMTEHGYAL